jgi:hypothetical protein
MCRVWRRFVPWAVVQFVCGGGREAVGGDGGGMGGMGGASALISYNRMRYRLSACPMMPHDKFKWAERAGGGGVGWGGSTEPATYAHLQGPLSLFSLRASRRLDKICN